MNFHDCTSHFTQTDHSVTLLDQTIPGVELSVTSETYLSKPLLAVWYGKAFAKAGITPRSRYSGGCSIIVAPNTFVEEPLTACFYLTSNQTAQTLRNLIIIGEGATATVQSYCSSQDNLDGISHSGDTEIICLPGSHLTYSMVHDWSYNTRVCPHISVLLFAGSTYQEEYNCQRTPDRITLSPHIFACEKGITISSFSKVAAQTCSRGQFTPTIHLDGPFCQAHVETKTLCSQSTIETKPSLLVSAPHCQAHVECHGMLKDTSSNLSSVPLLDCSQQDSEISHEASIGKLNPQEMEYLASRGFSQTECQQLLTQAWFHGL